MRKVVSNLGACWLSYYIHSRVAKGLAHLGHGSWLLKYELKPDHGSQIFICISAGRNIFLRFLWHLRWAKFRFVSFDFLFGFSLLCYTVYSARTGTTERWGN